MASIVQNKEHPASWKLRFKYITFNNRYSLFFLYLITHPTLGNVKSKSKDINMQHGKNIPYIRKQFSIKVNN